MQLRGCLGCFIRFREGNEDVEEGEYPDIEEAVVKEGMSENGDEASSKRW